MLGSGSWTGLRVIGAVTALEERLTVAPIPSMRVRVSERARAGGEALREWLIGTMSCFARHMADNLQVGLDTHELGSKG